MSSKRTVALCSSAKSGVEFRHLILALKEQYEVCVEYVHISSRILENGHDFSQYDGVILIHSVFRGRLSLTDVIDAQYNTLLPHWKSIFGSDRVAVIVTGAERTKDLEERFKKKQPTVSECSAHVLFCGAGDPMNDEHVTKAIASFVTQLKDLSTFSKVVAKTSKATTTRNDDNSNKDTMTIIAKTVKCAGIDVENSKDKTHVELIICAEGSTRETLLKTLSEADVKDEADFLIFQQKADDWELLEARSINKFDPSSKLTHCAVFIYTNEVPPGFTEENFKEFEKIINGRTNPTDIDVSGKANDSCLQQLLNVFLQCTFDNHIVTFSPGDVNMESSFSRNPTQREREHQYEATLKKEARGRIQIMNQTISTLRQEVSCKEDELATCEENIRVKNSEKKKIQSDVDAIQKRLTEKNEELRSLADTIEEAKEKLKEILNRCQSKEIAVKKVPKEDPQILEEKGKVSMELHDPKNAVAEANKELNQIKEEEKQASTESYEREIAVKKVATENHKIQKGKEQVSTELHDLKNVVTEANKKLNKIQEKTGPLLNDRDIAVENEAIKQCQIQKEKEQVSTELHDREAATEHHKILKEKEQVSTELHDLQNVVTEANKELIEIQENTGPLLNDRDIAVEKEAIKQCQIQKEKEQVSTELHDLENVTKKEEKEGNEENCLNGKDNVVGEGASLEAMACAVVVDFEAAKKSMLLDVEEHS